jgi:zinc D-Ala-D-Ala carboxypeptidase
MNLSTNFSFSELTRSTSHPELVPVNQKEAEAYLDNLRNQCTYLLQPLRNLLNKPITVTSGFRGETLNSVIGGTPTSDHSTGRATDFVVDGMTAKELFEFIQDNKGIFTGWMHKCILEEIGSKQWIHLAHRRPDEALGAFFVTSDGKSYERVA